MVHDHAPKSLLWDITTECNLRCKHCYNAKYWSKSMRSRELSTTDALRTIDAACDFGIRHIHFLGGEPLTRPDLQYLIDYVKNRALVVSINTNGLLLEPPTVNWIIQAGVDQITISLDGVTAEENDAVRGRGSFDNVVRNIRSVVAKCTEVQRPPVVQLAFVMTQINCRNAWRLPALAASMGVRLLNLLTLYECGEAEHHLTSLRASEQDVIQAIAGVVEAVGRKNGMRVQIDCKPRVLQYVARRVGISFDIVEPSPRCYAGEQMWALDATGCVHPCGPCSTRLGQTACESGALEVQRIDIRETLPSLEGIPTSNYWKSLMVMKDRVGDSRTDSVGCGQCEWARECWVCPLANSDASPDPLCRMVMDLEPGLYAELGGDRLRLRAGVRVSGAQDSGAMIQVVDFLLRKSYKVTQTESRLLQEMALGVATVEEVVSRVAGLEAPGHTSNRRRLMDKVFEYLDWGIVERVDAGIPRQR